MKKVYFLCAAMAVLKYLNDHVDMERSQRLELKSDGECYWLASYDNGKSVEDKKRMDVEALFNHLITLLKNVEKASNRSVIGIGLDDAFYSYVRGKELPILYEE